MANWADPHQYLLERVSDFCTMSDVCISPDYIRMQSVCKSWHSILKTRMMQRELPWLMMLPNKEEEEERDPDTRIFFSLSKQKIHTIPLPEIRGKRCCGSFKNGWLMTVDLKLDICLFHPWLQKKINLPHQSTFKRQNFVESNGFTIDEARDLEIVKAALSDDGNVLVVAYGLGTMGFCRIGDDAYTHIRCNAPMDDVIYHKGKFYSLSHAAGVWLLHIEDGLLPHAEQVTIPLGKISGTYFGYLVPDISTDRMFVIPRVIERLSGRHETRHFEVYYFSLEEWTHDKMLKKLTKVESLGDRVMFLGHHSSKIVMASQFPGLKGNRIYFADNLMQGYYQSPDGCCGSGVFNFEEDGTIEELFTDRFHPMVSHPIWIATPPYSS